MAEKKKYGKPSLKNLTTAKLPTGALAKLPPPSELTSLQPGTQPAGLEDSIPQMSCYRAH